MLELKTYSMDELSEILGTDNTQGIKRKLEGYNIDYEKTGRGKKATYTIKKINDEFKVFCILELKFSAQSDFYRLKYFLYFFFNDDDFQKLPIIGMSEMLTIKGKSISSKTISNYIENLEKLDLITRGGKFTYYVVKNGVREVISESQYKKAWAVCRKNKSLNDNADVKKAIKFLGGYPIKVPIYEFNAFYLSTLDKLQKLVIESIDKDLTENN